MPKTQCQTQATYCAPSETQLNDGSQAGIGNERNWVVTLSDCLTLGPLCAALAAASSGENGGPGEGSESAAQGDGNDSGDLSDIVGLASDIAQAMENAELARSIAGHAAEEHFGVDAEEGADIIENVLESRDSMTRDLQNGRTAYYNDGVIVIKNPKVPYGGTAYPGSFNDFLKLR